MRQYLDLLQDVLDNGVIKQDRTGIGTISVFGRQLRFDLSKGFPAVTTKRLAFKSVVSELLWFLEGSTDERRLAEIHYQQPREQLVGKTTIWTANADNQGKALGYTNTDTEKQLGPIYGRVWRDWNNQQGKPIDQIKNLIDTLKTNPNDRRMILTAWNVDKLPEQALPPCHCFAQFYVANGKLSCQMYQRSCDLFLGVPFNIASYSLLTHMIAQVCDLQVGEFIHTLGDTHIYLNHIQQVKTQLQRDPLQLPTLLLNPEIKNIDDFTVNDIHLAGYLHHSSITGQMAV